MFKIFNTNPFFECDKINPNLDDNPWTANRIFAYWFIQQLKPRTLVELGSHYGCSFFSFCQCVKDFQLKTTLHAIDTWVGDKQAGYYEDEVYDMFKHISDEKYTGLSINIIRKYFHDAVNSFADNSIDVLNIDGLHTYESAKSDFETWRPKLNYNGVIMFHDIGEFARDKGYGSAQHWDEIKNDYKHLEFLHEWGLGIIFLSETTYNDIVIIEQQTLVEIFTALQRYHRLKNDERFLKARIETLTDLLHQYKNEQ